VIRQEVHLAHHHHIHINQKFKIGILLNTLFIIFELGFGIMANSMALLADAAHNIGDILGLLLAWFGYWISHRKAPKHFTFGFKQAPILAAFMNAILLLVAVGGISWEALKRLAEHESVQASIVIWVGALGVLINGMTAMLFFKDRHEDLNLKGAYLHMLADAAVSLVVIFGALLVLWTSWAWIDSVLCLGIAVLILFGSWGLLRDSTELLLQASPRSVNIETLKQVLKEIPEVESYHDLHVWPLGTTESMMSIHIVVKQAEFNEGLCSKIREQIKRAISTSHITIQIETELHETCLQNCN
jgi:cobalt-zinc-cadmium efflux system protein